MSDKRIKVADALTPEPLPPRHDSREMPVTKGEMRRSFRLNEVYTLLVAVATAAAALLGAYRLYVSEARAAGAEEAARVQLRVDATQVKADATQRELERYQGEVSARLSRVEAAADDARETGRRNEKKLDRMLDKMEIPNPAPAPRGPR